MPEDFDTNGLVFSTNVISGGGAGGNAMTGYRTQNTNATNWLFGNPVADQFNNFIATNQDFQQSFAQGMFGAGRTLQTGLQQAQQWAANSQNVIYTGAAIIVGLVVVSKLLGGKKRR